jgi:serpin B
MTSLVPVGCLLLTLPAAAPAPPAPDVLVASNRFALDLYSRLRGPEGNLILSPYSVTKALAMAYAGARGETAREMAAVMHMGHRPEALPAAFGEARRALNAGAAGRGVDLRLAAALWAPQGYCDQTYLARLQGGFGAGLYPADFRTPERARRTINAWVGRNTGDKINDLFPSNSFDESTCLVLASAIYFKGDWAHAFPREQTREETFHAGFAAKVRVPMMHQTGTFGYFEDDRLQGLQMGYGQSGLAMLVLLPRRPDGLAELESSLTADRLAAWTTRLMEQRVDVSLPRFRLTGSFALADVLAGMGMRQAFGAGADFGSINGEREPLHISRILHAACVDVAEQGTEAAAATAVEMNTIGLPPAAQPTPVFRVDHPFLFVIREVHTGTILFLGRMVRP